ncbi:MAG: glycosyltransferase, partial [Pseudomonadota bacterium]
MSNIVCMTSGLRGLLNASFEVVSRLKRDGHRLTYACPHDVGELVRGQGIDYVQLPPTNFDPAPPPPGGRFLKRFTRSATAESRREAGVRALGMDDFRSVIEDLAPDLVLVDTEMYEYIFTLQAMGVPVLGLSPFFAQWPGLGLPPLALSATPADTDAVSRHLALRAEQIESVSRKYERTERRSVLLAYAESLGLDTKRLEQTGALMLFVDTQLPTLLLTARELDFPHAPPDNAHFVGPMVAMDRTDADVDAGDRERLDGVLSQDRTGPLLYCPLSTMNTSQGDFAQRLVACVAERPEWTLVVAGARDLDDSAPNVHAFGYLPQMRVLVHADLCITMAGMNTVHESLMAGVPMLAFPMHYDQPGVASRLAHRGLAHVGAAEDSADRMGARIERALADTDLSENV